MVLDIDGPPGRSVEISEFVFESGPVSSRVRGRAIVTAEGPPDPMRTTGYFAIRGGERSAIYRLVGAMSRMKSGRTVLDCTGFRQTDAAEFPVSTWIRLTVDETTVVVYVERTRPPSEGGWDPRKPTVPGNGDELLEGRLVRVKPNPGVGGSIPSQPTILHCSGGRRNS